MLQITKYIALCLVLAGLSGRATAQAPDTDIQDIILGRILGLQFALADSLITAAGRDPGMGPGIIYLRNYLEFLDALVAGDGQRYERYLAGAADRLDTLRSLQIRANGQAALISAIHLQSSFLNAFQGDHFKAARNFLVARRYYQLAEASMPGDPVNDKLGGLIQLIAGTAPADYHWLMKIFGIRGDIRLGAEKLAAYHEKTYGQNRTESCLILLYTRLLTGYEMPDLQQDCTGDTATLQRYFLAYHALRSGHSREAIELLGAWHQAPGEADFAYPDLLLGEALLDIQHSGAGDKLVRFLDRTRGKHLVKSAWHKLSWHHFLEGDTAAYNMARDSVLEKGNMILDADKQAFREASEDGLPNAILLRSRLLFDGGDYQGASDILQEIRPGELSRSRDSLEYAYRQARIAERLGKSEEAISKYQEVMEAGGGSTLYFPSNAALHLGMIHEAMGDTVRAIESYQACLKMNRSAYRNSIGNKARLGIRRLDRDP